MVTQNTFPQSGDKAYAEDWAALSGHTNLSDYVETGLEFTNADWSAPSIDVTTGKAYVIKDSISKGNGETVLRALYAVHVPQTSLSLTDNAVNYVYLNGNVDTNDSPQLTVYTDQTNSGSDEVLLGTVDTTNDTTTLENRNPDVEFSHARAHDDLGIPVYDETSNAVTGEGNVVYITGNGSDTQGVWFYTTSGWQYSGIQTLRDSDVSGVTALIEDTSGNRPAAGTEGRLFFSTDGQAVYYDDGTSWVRLALDASQIGAGDLGFDTATQSELNSHSDTSDAHHTRYSNNEARSAVTGIALSNPIILEDGIGLELGTNSDTAIRYDATNDDVRVADESNTTDRMALDRTTGDLTITGELTENASL